MPALYDPQLVHHPKIILPAAGDLRSSAGVRLAVEQVADNVAVMMDYVAGNGPGIARIRAVADLAALKALAPVDDGDVCRIAAAIYVFKAGDGTQDDDVLVVKNAGNTGRWLHVAQPAAGVPYGLARLNASGKVVQDPASKGLASGVASLDASSRVIQDPASKGQAEGVASLDEDGRLLEDAKTVRVYASAADMRATTPVTDGMIARCKGLGLFAYDSSDVTSVDDGVNVLTLTNPANGRWLRVDRLQRGVPNGVASLDGDGFVPGAQLRRKWGRVNVTGSGGATRIGSEAFVVTLTLSTVDVAFENAMPDTNYAVVAMTEGSIHTMHQPVVTVRTASGFKVMIRDTLAQDVIDPTVTSSTFHFIVMA